MLKKRLVGVVTVKNGWAVQSLGYCHYLPLGKVECLVENLDRWGADEILVQVIDRSSHGMGPDFELLEKLGRMGLETPLIYAGGISSVLDGVRAIQLGADRIVMDALLHDDIISVRQLSECLGAQALITSLPLSYTDSGVVWYNYRLRTESPIPAEVLELIQTGVTSEVLLIDWKNEGRVGNFNEKLVQGFPLKDVSLLAFGGLGVAEPMARLLRQVNVSAVCVGNCLSYQEHGIQKIKQKLVGMPLRLPSYESRWSLL